MLREIYTFVTMVIYFSLILRSDVDENYYFYYMFFNLQKATFDISYSAFSCCNGPSNGEFSIERPSSSKLFLLIMEGRAHANWIQKTSELYICIEWFHFEWIDPSQDAMTVEAPLLFSCTE